MNNIKLRRLNIKDNHQIAKLANNKKVWDNLRDFIPFPYNLKDAEFFIDLTAKENPEQTFGVIYNDTLCGVISVLAQPDVYRKTAELGFWIGEEYWGKGIATKAIGLILKYGFDQLKLERIYAGVFDFNPASMKALEKNGFKKEGISRKAVYKNEMLCDEHRFALLRNEFKA